MKTRRIFFCFLVSVGYLFLVSGSSYAQAEKNYSNNGQIGFYGTYEYPEESTTEDTSSSTQTVTGGGNSTINEDKLPMTGDTSGKLFQVIGVIILLIGIYQLKYMQKKGWKS